MASSYRSIKPAFSRDGTFRKAPLDRVVPKRTGMIKSACWECRKRKAKCNGLKPACGNCAKWDAECIYDSDVRDAKVRSLQSANEKLEAELEAAKMLLKQVASGSDQTRSIVLELLQNAREPLEILEVVSNNGGIDSTMANPQVPHVPHVTSVPHLPTEGVLPNAEHFRTSVSISADDGYEHSLMAQAPLYQSPLNTAGHIPGYSTSLIEDSTSFQPPQVLQSQAPATSQNIIIDSPDSIHLGNNSTTISRQPGTQSLFFEPLFNHTDYYLTPASSVSERSLHNSHHRTTNHTDAQFPLMHEGLDHSEPSAVSDVDSYTSPRSNIPIHGEEAHTPSFGIHPNFRNHFNNLSLSSSIRVNGYPRTIQDAQIRNIFVPNWAATSLNAIPDPGHLDDAFGDIFKQATSLLKSGEPVHRIAGHHPNIAALYDQQEFDRSCLLSQWAARMVHSVKRQGYDFTCFASMNVFWYMMRWMIDPSPESYAAMPEWIRPTSHQLFTPHISMVDFVLWPDFRELIVQLPQLQERMAWLADMSLYIRCDWPYPLEQALHRNPISGDIDLADLAKQHVWTLGCWSVGPSFRRFLPNADSYLLIRPEEEPGSV